MSRGVGGGGAHRHEAGVDVLRGVGADAADGAAHAAAAFYCDVCEAERTTGKHELVHNQGFLSRKTFKAFFHGKHELVLL